MHDVPEHLTLRDCLHPPISQLHEAADLLSRAADALLVGELDRAEDLLRLADMPVVHAHASRIMGQLDKSIHRYRPARGRVDKLTQGLRIAQRRPSSATERAIYRRDGYRCRFCGCRVVLGAARDAMRALAPDAIRWGRRSKDMHGAFFALTATLDHLVPHSWGGTNEADNLLTTCWPCNFGRNDALIEEVSLFDPRLRAPVLDEWDGLNRMLALKIGSARQRESKTGPMPHGGGIGGTARFLPVADAQAHRAWFDQLDRSHGGTSARLLSFLDECEELRVSWKLNKVLLVYVRARDMPLSMFGIESSGDVNVPWWIGPHKIHSQVFAETIADAIPEAVAYESPKMWQVRKAGRKLTIMELLNVAPEIKAAFRELNLALKC